MPGVAHTVAISGTSFLLSTNGSNLGSMFVVLENPSTEKKPRRSTTKPIAQKIQERVRRKSRGPSCCVFRAPPIRGLGNAGGFQLQTEQYGTFDLPELQKETDQLVQRLNSDPRFAGVFTLFRSAIPGLFVDINRTKVQALQIPIQDVFTTLNVYMGGLYVNQFNQFGLTWQVQVEAAPEFRTTADMLKQFQVRTSQGQMVPLGAIAAIRNSAAPLLGDALQHVRLRLGQGHSGPGVSTGTMIDDVTRIAKEMGIPFEWTQMTYLEVQAGNIAPVDLRPGNAPRLFRAGRQIRKLEVAAGGDPRRPAVHAGRRGGHDDRPAADRHLRPDRPVGAGRPGEQECDPDRRICPRSKAPGKELHEAALTASKIRFRPIIMTSFAFIFGVMPLVLATGAGAEMRQSLGTAVFSGMIGVTLFGIFLTPVFFFALSWLADRRHAKASGPGSTEAA